MKKLLRLLGLLAFVPARAHAIITVGTGVTTDIPHILAGILSILLGWSSLVATALFLGGALWMVGSGGNDARVTTAKTIMKASLVGLAIVVGSWLILSTAVSFIN